MIELSDDQRATIDTIALEAHDLDPNVRHGLAKDASDWPNDFDKAAAYARQDGDEEHAMLWDDLAARAREALESFAYSHEYVGGSLWFFHDDKLVMIVSEWEHGGAKGKLYTKEGLAKRFAEGILDYARDLRANNSGCLSRLYYTAVRYACRSALRVS